MKSARKIMALMTVVAALVPAVPAAAVNPFPDHARATVHAHSHARALVRPGSDAGACALDAVTLETFIPGQAGLSGAAKQQLDALAGALADQACSVSISGYASIDGDHLRNQRLAAGRAEAVRSYLQAIDAQFVSATAIGLGETSRFGPQLADNQRVTIEFHNP